MQYSSSCHEVWAALTDPQSLGQWLKPLTAGAGRRMRFGAIVCEVLAAEPPARLVWRWRDPHDGRTFLIDWRLEAVAGGCRLRLEQREADETSGDSSFICGCLAVTAETDDSDAVCAVWAQRNFLLGPVFHDSFAHAA
jgi:uncharacterized protein YndB with AHSA1/START domain